MFKSYIESFNENIVGLRDFVELINPFLTEHENSLAEQHKGALAPLELARKHFLEKDEEKKSEYAEKLKQVFDGEIEVSLVSDELQSKGGKKSLSIKVKGDTTKMNSAFEVLAKTIKQKELLYQNSLISLVSTTEWFFSQLLHYYYDKFPESAGVKKKTLTLEELKSFNSVKDAESYLIDDKIESILRSSFKDWVVLLKTELSLKLSFLKDFESELYEFYLRRNLLVHNGGKINSIYLSKVDDKYKEKFSIGDKVTVDELYLERAISLLHSVFTLIACELWKKLEPAEEARHEILMNLGYAYLKKGCWDVSEIASIFHCNDVKMPIASRTTAQLNFWLAKKRSGKLNDVKKDVAEADFSDKSRLFQVALYALREEEDKFFAMLPQVIKTEELSISDLFEFPIFEEMIKCEKFEAFAKEFDIVILSDVEVIQEEE